MNEKLKELYYRDDVIIGSKQNFINLAKQKLKASTKEINEFLKYACRRSGGVCPAKTVSQLRYMPSDVPITGLTEK